jgi:hypothetical protein
MKILYTILLTLLLVACRLDQTSDEQSAGAFVKYFGSSTFQEGRDVLLIDSDYLLFGSFEVEGADGVHHKEFYLVKTDRFGNVYWSKKYGTDQDDVGVSCIRNDDGFVLIGNTKETDGTANILVIMVDHSGNEIKRKTFGTALNEEAVHACATTDGGYVIVGNQSNLTDVGSVVYYIKISADGDLEWEKTKGNYTEVNTAMYVAQLNNTDFLVTGVYSSLPLGGGNQANSNVLLMKLNDRLDDYESVTYGGLNDDYGRSFTIYEGEVYITGGTDNNTSGEEDVFVTKVDLSNIFEVAELKTFGGVKNDEAVSIQKAEGGFVISGSTSSFISSGSEQMLLKVTDELNEDWLLTYGSTGENQANKVIPTSDGGFVFIGNTVFAENSMMSLIKTDADGVIK